MEWNFEAHQKSTVADILATDLPPDEKKKFKEWSQEVNTDDFNKILGQWFTEDVIKNAIASYISERLEELEHFTGAEIAGAITVAGRLYEFRNINGALHV
jgi:hypothetical protein